MNHPDGNTLAQQRCGQGRPPANLRLVKLGLRELGFELGCKVTNMYGLTVDHGATANGTTGDGYSPLANSRRYRYRSIRSDQPKNLTVETKNYRIFRAAHTRGILRHNVEPGLNICRRAGNDTQDFTRCSLLLQ